MILSYEFLLSFSAVSRIQETLDHFQIHTPYSTNSSSNNAEAGDAPSSVSSTQPAGFESIPLNGIQQSNPQKPGSGKYKKRFDESKLKPMFYLARSNSAYITY